jgi:hypothetical protein
MSQSECNDDRKQLVVMRESSLKWKVRFKTPDDMYTFVNIKKSGGFALDREEVEEWANEQVRTNSFYASVADIINEEVGV